MFTRANSSYRHAHSARNDVSHSDNLDRYFGAPWGALLLGPAALVKPLFHERRMLGGACTNAALAAAMALEGMKSFPVRCFDCCPR